MPETKGIPEHKRPVCRLAGEDGNAYAIMARVSAALMKAGLREEARAYRAEALSGDYDHLLQVSMSYVRDGDPDADNECVECGEPLDGLEDSELCEACEEEDYRHKLDLHYEEEDDDRLA